MRNIFAGLAAVALAACSHVDTGQIDYRVADKVHCEPQSGKKCEPSLASLDRRYEPSAAESEAPFQANDVYSIEIEQAMIGTNIMEGHILGRQIGKSAEIAILANVFEFGASDEEAAQRRFLQSGQWDRSSEDPSDVELKLIYYGDDIKKHQPLNFSNIPLKPRNAYLGGSVGVQIVVMEVDAQSGPVASLLTTLARFGQQAIPVSTEVSDLLFDLGESLFTGGSGDDRLFEYRFVLSAAAADPDAVQATFSPGRYVLWRSQDRNIAQKWQDVKLDLNTGRLVKNDDHDEVRDDLYMVLNVCKYPDGTASEAYAFDNWSGFRSKLQKEVDDRTKPVEKVTEAVSEAIRDRRSEDWRSQLFGKWSFAEGRLSAVRSRTVKFADDSDFSSCTRARDTVARRRQEAERNARDALRGFVAEYQAATKGTGPAEEFVAEDREALVSRVARFFMPWTGDIERHFADATTFDAFATDAAGLIPEAISTAASASREVKSCNDLGGTV